MEKKKNWKQKAAVGAVCAATGAGVLVNGMFDTPADLLQGSDSGPAGIVAQCDDDSPLVEDEEEEDRKSGPVRRWILSLPLYLRVLLGLPLWAAGWGITELAGLLWKLFLTPLGSTVASWLLTAALAIGAFALLAKAIFPDLPLKKLFSRRNLLLILGGTLLLGLLDTVLSAAWEGYPDLGRWLRLGGVAALLALGWIRAGRLLPKPVANVPLTAAQQAMKLADTVCPPRYH